MIPCAIVLLADGEKASWILLLLGRLHPAVVHFPIALLTIAAMLESWQLVRRQPRLAVATPLCLVVGALSAVVACVLGWFLDEFDGGGGDLVGLHKWLGIVAAAAAVIAAALIVQAAKSTRALAVLRVALISGAALVGATGYLGGELVFGSNHLFKGLFEEKKPNSSLSADPVSKGTPTGTVPVGKVDFAQDVAPILKNHCLRCHGDGKPKGKFSLKTRAAAMKGGESGACIVARQPDNSLLYTLLLQTDQSRMPPPPKEKPLSPEQIETIRQWIAQGANWPEAVEIQ